MNDSENFDAPPETVANRSNEMEALQKMFQATLVALLILSLAVNLFLYRQRSFVKQDLTVARPQVAQILANYQRAEEGEAKRFINALVNYAQTHPEFTPILTKYKIPLQAQSSAPGAAPKK